MITKTMLRSIARAIAVKIPIDRSLFTPVFAAPIFTFPFVYDGLIDWKVAVGLHAVGTWSYLKCLASPTFYELASGFSEIILFLTIVLLGTAFGFGVTSTVLYGMIWYGTLLAGCCKD
jgi:hypothetical protein